eukprot:gene7141-9744_t
MSKLFQGELDAKDAGMLLGDRGIVFDIAFTSNLERAWRTCAIALLEANQSNVEIIRSWKLNERHYGALQGHRKHSPMLMDAFGSDNLLEWRRSFLTAPPSFYDINILRKIGKNSFACSTQYMDQRYIDSRNSKYSSISSSSISSTVFPSTESLKQCQDRAYGFWLRHIAPRIRDGENVLTVAHANTIRALIKAIDNVDDTDIDKLKIPNGVPFVYSFDEHLNPIDLSNDLGVHANYLVSAKNHAKVMRYERSNVKKLKSIFEFLDKDGDGVIHIDELLDGLHVLHESEYNRYKSKEHDKNLSNNQILNESNPIQENVTHQNLKNNNYQVEDGDNSFEYEVEEIIRCIPRNDQLDNNNNNNNGKNYDYNNDTITLESFLECQATLLPRLKRLRLLT